MVVSSFRLRLILIGFCVICLLGISPYDRNSNKNFNSSYWTIQDISNEEVINQSVPPARKLDLLRSRLGLVQEETNISNSTKDWHVGTRKSFWVLNQESNSYLRKRAVLQLVTPNAYWFVEEGMGFSKFDLRQAADQFESLIPNLRSVFGTEWRPGIDDDPRIVIFIGNIPGVGGYYSSNDEYPSSVSPYSNGHEIIYVNSDPGSPSFISTLAHEFQHMIHWYQHANQDVWINEGMSEYASELSGHIPLETSKSFANNPDVQLSSWSSNPDDALSHYGQSYRLMSYLAYRFGSDILRGIIRSKYPGLLALSETLSAYGYDWTKVYSQWLIANLVDIKGNKMFGYKFDQPNVKYASLDISSDLTADINQWGADYYKLPQNSSDYYVFFEADPRVPLLPVLPKKGQKFWYSDRGDLVDSTLTRQIDLSKVKKATLQVDLWYDIETGYDYGYVMVSRDAGKTWTTLRGKHSTTSNPSGNNLGNGYTGKSGGWITDTFDLTPYAGRKILLRFEYVTDDGYNSAGMAVDGVRIPEIGFYDDMESPNGWQANGWVLSGPYVPGRYSLIILDANSPERYVLVDAGADGRAIYKLSAQDPKDEPFLIVTAKSDNTLQKSIYRIQILPKEPGYLTLLAGRASR